MRIFRLCVFRYASELTLPRSIHHYSTNFPSFKELTDFQQLPENPLDMLARLFWIGVSLLESDFEHEFVMAVNLIEEVAFSLISLYIKRISDK